MPQKILRRLHRWVLRKMRDNWKTLVAKNKEQGFTTRFFAPDEALQGMGDENAIPLEQVLRAPWEEYHYAITPCR
jgi:hypothetical protein